MSKTCGVLWLRANNSTTSGMQDRKKSRKGGEWCGTQWVADFSTAIWWYSPTFPVKTLPGVHTLKRGLPF